MNVYIPYSDADRFESFVIVDDEEHTRLLNQFDGTPMAQSWSPVRITVLREGPGEEDLPPSDFPALGRIPVFSARAADALAGLLEGRGELLPLDYDDGEYYAFNVTRLSDALDETRSELEYFESSGRIMDIARYEFIPERLVTETIFKLPQIPEMYEYVTDVFVGRVEERGLTGFVFNRCVWTGPDPEPKRSVAA